MPRYRQRAARWRVCNPQAPMSLRLLLSLVCMLGALAWSSSRKGLAVAAADEDMRRRIRGKRGGSGGVWCVQFVSQLLILRGSSISIATPESRTSRGLKRVGGGGGGWGGERERRAAHHRVMHSTKKGAPFVLKISTNLQKGAEGVCSIVPCRTPNNSHFSIP
jgi:hypothetical protein